MRRLAVALFLSLAAMLAVWACGDDPVEPPVSLEGAWNLVGFSDGGIEAVVTGTAVFRADGTFSVAGDVTFPDEPTEPILVEGTYRTDAGSVELTIGGVTTTWSVDFTGPDVVTLTEIEPPPANTITLERA